MRKYNIMKGETMNVTCGYLHNFEITDINLLQTQK